MVGVTVNQGERTSTIKLWIDRYNAPYVITKPLYHSQTMEKEYEDGSIEVVLKVKINFELERLILGFGDAIEVLKPQKLRNRIFTKLGNAARRYVDKMD